MGDYSISIVPKQSNYKNKEKKIEEILKWLISRDIIKSSLSDCILSSDNGYSISNGAKTVTNQPEYLPFSLVVNGLEIITERVIFDTGQNGIETLICPSCNQNIASEDWNFLNEWAANESDNLTCPLCNTTTDIHKYKFTPEWGFSNLGFCFWNWPQLTESFIEEFKEKLDSDISIVYRKI